MAATHEVGEFPVHDTDQGLARSQRADDLLADGLGPNLRDEVLDHRQSDVGLQQRHAHLAQCLLDIVLGQAGLATQFLDDTGEALGKVVQHVGIRRMRALE